MFCPDCGRDCDDSDNSCPLCGYPLNDLRQRLAGEERESLGWAEKIVGKPEDKSEEPPDDSLVSFATGKEKPREDEKEKDDLKCERCGAKVGIGVMCPGCGDRLPTLGESDPYLTYIFLGLWRMIVAPRNFALNFPYPVKGGTLQAFWVPGIFAGIYILTLPLSRPASMLHSENPVNPFALGLVGLAVYVLAVPPLLYLTTGLIHWTAKILGGRAPFRRTARIAGAGLIGLLILGIFRNLIFLLFFFVRTMAFQILENRFGFELSYDSGQDTWRILLILIIIFAGWQYAWMFGGLHRLAWWKTIVHFLATYVALLWWIWTAVLIVIPLRIAGYL